MDHTIAALLAVIVLQQVFFMRQVQKLVDKVMSRNYAEYSQSEKLKNSENVKREFQIETEPLDDLNRVLG